MLNSFSTPQSKLLSYEADIRTLISFLDEHDSWENPTKYTIVEYFPPDDDPSYQSREYTISNLTMELENDTVVSDGYLNEEDISLLDNWTDNDIIYQLNVFLLDSIECIGFNHYLKYITITLDTGFIRIKY